MPQRKSAKKELKKSQKRRVRNLQAKKQIKKTIKSFTKALESGNNEEAKKLLNQVYKIMDKYAGKKIISKNKAARKKGSLTKSLNKKIKK